MYVDGLGAAPPTNCLLSTERFVFRARCFLSCKTLSPVRLPVLGKGPAGPLDVDTNTQTNPQHTFSHIGATPTWYSAASRAMMSMMAPAKAVRAALFMAPVVDPRTSLRRLQEVMLTTRAAVPQARRAPRAWCTTSPPAAVAAAITVAARKMKNSAHQSQRAEFHVSGLGVGESDQRWVVWWRGLR